jgi:RNA polymerase-binding transcription factor DksA
MPLPAWDGFPTLGWQVIDWMEAYLPHGPGDVQGEPWELDDEFALFILWAYRVYPKGHARAGRRMVQRAILSRPKGRAKSEFAGGLDCAEALGPVRCDGFDAEGEPVGVPVRYPFIRCMATEEDQSGNTYDNVRYMLEEGEVANAYAVDVGLTRTFIKEPGGGEIVPSTSGDASKDGGKESKATADETHLYVLPKLRQMYGTVARNTGKRKDAEPWILDTTTAWQPGERSVAEQAAERYAHLPTLEAVEKFGVLYDHRQAPEPKRFGDNRSLIKALKEVYGPAAEWMDFERIVRVIRDAEDPEDTAYRYFLNRPRAAASHWLVPTEIKAVMGKVEWKPKQPITLGFDGSENDDHTALKACTEAGDLFTIGVWRPSGDDIGWRDEVDEAVDWAFETFDVVRDYNDPAKWGGEVARWAAKHGSPPVVEFWTGGRSEGKMAVATGALRTEIRHEAVVIDPNPILTEPITVDPNGTPTEDGIPIVQWHYENARTRKVRVRKEDDTETEDAILVRKERRGSPLKIDSVTSDILARRARDDAMKTGEFEGRQVEYGRASWSDGGGSSRKKVKKSDYFPCVNCGKPIHPNRHKDDVPAGERGRCMKCRLSQGG